MAAAPTPRPPFATPYHAPVLVAEVLEVLGGARTVLDGTLGGGGHSAALLAAGAQVTGVDQDPEAIAAARARLHDFEAAGRFRAIQSNFGDLAAHPALAGETFEGILLDLGVSSRQLDEDARGFSFRPGAPLDARMGPDAPSAGEWLDETPEAEVAYAFREYGDEPRARRLAAEVVRRRATAPFRTADDLVGAIRGALGPRTGPSDFARLFQAVRIAVNDELTVLDRALPALRDRLAPGGVLAVIAYHSGEDRLVKQAFRAWSTACTCPPRQPVCTCGGVARGTLVTRKAIVAGEAEIAGNPRARSARLRAFRRGDR